MYRIVFAKILVFTFSAWILRACDNEKGLSYNVNNGLKNAQTGLQLRVSRLLSVSDLESEVDYSSLESLADRTEKEEKEEREEKEEKYERPVHLNSHSFSFDDDEELDPDLETFKEYIRYVAKSDKSFKDKLQDTKDYIKNMDPMTRKKIKREIRDKVNESRRMKHRRKCMKFQGLSQDMYRDLKHNNYKMMVKMRKMEKKMSVLSGGSTIMGAILAYLVYTLQLLSTPILFFFMGFALLYLVFKKM